MSATRRTVTQGKALRKESKDLLDRITELEENDGDYATITRLMIQRKNLEHRINSVMDDSITDIIIMK